MSQDKKALNNTNLWFCIVNTLSSPSLLLSLNEYGYASDTGKPVGELKGYTSIESFCDFLYEYDDFIAITWYHKSDQLDVMLLWSENLD